MASYEHGKDEICKWIKENFPKGSTCLDVGACDGVWANRLNDYLIMDGVEIFEPYLEKYNLSEEEYIYIGDDVNDLESLSKTKYAFTVPNAVEKVRLIKNIQVTTNVGGSGAFREIVDSLLQSF